ncbi:hypothetical protein BH10ACT2_BH10ACT2_25030 [soil metagenome]
MNGQRVAVGEVKPGDHDDLIALVKTGERWHLVGLDAKHRIWCAELIGLTGSVHRIDQPGLDVPDYSQRGKAGVHDSR